MNRSSALCYYVFECRLCSLLHYLFVLRRRFKTVNSEQKKKKKVGGVWAPIDCYVCYMVYIEWMAVRGECCAMAIRSDMYVAWELLTEGSFNDAALCAVALPPSACICECTTFVCVLPARSVTMLSSTYAQTVNHLKCDGHGLKIYAPVHSTVWLAPLTVSRRNLCNWNGSRQKHTHTNKKYSKLITFFPSIKRERERERMKRKNVDEKKEHSVVR